MENQVDIEEVKRTIKFLQELVGNVGEGKSSARKTPSLGDPEYYIWNDQVIMATFKISSKTVARHRKNGKFKAFPIGRIYFYYRDDILPFRNGFLR